MRGVLIMKCPYNNFNECYGKDCPAWKYVEDPLKKGYFMRVCAIAYDGGVPNNVVVINDGVIEFKADIRDI